MARLRREHVEHFMAHLVQTYKPATAANRFRRLEQLFKWLEEEGEVAVSPMAKMHPPKVPEVPVPVLSDDDLRRLLATCAGMDHVQRRDTAIISLFLDTGMRLAELTNLTMADLDLDEEVAVGWARVAGHGPAPSAARRPPTLDRYIRARRTHASAGEPWLWLGSLAWRRIRSARLRLA